MMTPVKYGGFGMVDFNAMNEALDLRSYGRLLTSNHPIFAQLREMVNHDDFFNVTIEGEVDKKFRISLEILSGHRKEVLKWEQGVALANVDLRQIIMETKVSDLITDEGKRSLNYFLIRARQPQARVYHLSRRDLGAIRRFLKNKDLNWAIEGVIGGQPLNNRIERREAYPMGGNKLVKISELSSREIRENRTKCDEVIICLYKVCFPFRILSHLYCVSYLQ